MADIIGPTSHFFYSQRLKLHYVDWGNHDKPLAMLVHGGRDHCPQLGFRRARSPRPFPYRRARPARAWRFRLGDRRQLLDNRSRPRRRPVAQRARPSGPPCLIGHSLGAGVVLQRAGVFPEAVKAVIAIEGLGPPGAMLRETPAHERMENWVSRYARARPAQAARISDASSRPWCACARPIRISAQSWRTT